MMGEIGDDGDAERNFVLKVKDRELPDYNLCGDRQKTWSPEHVMPPFSKQERFEKI